MSHVRQQIRPHSGVESRLPGCTKAIGVLTLAVAGSAALAEEDNWRWAREWYDWSARRWERSIGVAEACRRTANEVVLSLYCESLPGQELKETWLAGGKSYRLRHPGHEQAAELRIQFAAGRAIRGTYQRWGTDEGAMRMQVDYFSHGHSGEGYEGLSLQLVGLDLIGLRHDLQRDSRVLMQLPIIGNECPVSEVSEVNR